MTGTGTQADPYLVTTLGEFITAIGQSDTYVKLANDIEVSMDPTYKNGINSLIEVYCTAIDGDGHTISGLNVKSTQVFRFARASLVKNITIKNVMLNCSSSSSYLITCNAVNSTYATFQNVVISARMNCNNVCYGCFCNNGIWNNCAITFMVLNTKQCTTNSDNLNIFNFTKATECAIRYDCDRLLFGSYGNVFIVLNAEDSYIFGKINSMQTKYSGTLFRSCVGCASYLDITGTSSNASLYTLNDRGLNIIVTDLITGVSFNNMPSTSKCLTSEQAKSEEYLNSIGFLP